MVKDLLILPIGWTETKDQSLTFSSGGQRWKTQNTLSGIYLYPLKPIGMRRSDFLEIHSELDPKWSHNLTKQKCSKRNKYDM